MARTKRLEIIPPGEILAEEFMKPNGLSQNRLARDMTSIRRGSMTSGTAAPRSPPRSRSGYRSISAPRRSCG